MTRLILTILLPVALLVVFIGLAWTILAAITVSDAHEAGKDEENL